MKLLTETSRLSRWLKRKRNRCQLNNKPLLMERKRNQLKTSDQRQILKKSNQRTPLRVMKTMKDFILTWMK